MHPVCLSAHSGSLGTYYSRVYSRDEGASLGSAIYLFSCRATILPLPTSKTEFMQFAERDCARAKRFEI
jgi:hypothetical protein